MNIDVRVLIELVRSRSLVWDKKNRSYHNRMTVEKSWLDIARKMKVPKILCKKKWKYLRDQFRSECKKIPAEKFFDSSLTAADYDGFTTWPYFKAMFFLKSQIRSRKLKRLYMSYKDGEAIGENQEEEEDDDEQDAAEVHGEDSKDVPIINAVQEEHQQQQQQDFERMFVLQNVPTISAQDYEEEIARTQPNIQVSNFAQNHTISRNDTEKRERQEKMDKLEKKLDILVQQNKQKYGDIEMDEDKAFFQSLLPHLNTLTPAQKLLCRIDIQRHVYKHAYKKDEEQRAPMQSNQDEPNLDFD